MRVVYVLGFSATLPGNVFGGFSLFVAIISTTFPAARKPEVPVTKQAVPSAPSHRLKDDAPSVPPPGNDFCGSVEYTA
jgi:hypothetical protein